MTPRKTIFQIFRFGLVGIIATFIHVSVAFLSEIFGLGFQASNFVGFASAVLFSFLGNKNYTFKAKGKHSAYLTRFFGLSVLNYCASAFIILLVSQSLGYPFALSLFAIVVVLPTLSFLVQKFWIFKSEPL